MIISKVLVPSILCPTQCVQQLRRVDTSGGGKQVKPSVVDFRHHQIFALLMYSLVQRLRRSIAISPGILVLTAIVRTTSCLAPY
jgi:hypothetical protein